jgi:MFS family permease
MGPPRAVFTLETVEILGMGMLWTSLPILLESDTQAQRWGLVTGVASAIGLSTGALFGRLSDVHGRQLVLLLAVLMFASANIFLATAQLPLPLFESVGVAPTTLLIVGALLGRCSTTGGALRKAFVADLSAPTERTAALGRLAACGGVGFVIGPTLAGRLADIDVNLAVRAQLLLATVAVCIALTIWKSSVSATPRAEAAGTSSPSRRPSRSSTRSRSPSRRSSRSPHRATSKPAAAAETFSLTKLLSSRTVSGLMAASFFLSFGFQAFVRRPRPPASAAPTLVVHRAR